MGRFASSGYKSALGYRGHILIDKIYFCLRHDLGLVGVDTLFLANFFLFRVRCTCTARLIDLDYELTTLFIGSQWRQFTFLNYFGSVIHMRFIWRMLA